MDTLIVTQTIFYMVSSVAIITLSVLIGIAVFNLIKVLKSTRKVSEDISQTYTKAKKGFSKIISLIKK
jgi:hypothetical protein